MIYSTQINRSFLLFYEISVNFISSDWFEDCSHLMRELNFSEKGHVPPENKSQIENIFFSCTVVLKRIMNLEKDLSWEISLAIENKYADIIGPLATIPIDFAPMLNFECVMQYFPQFFFQKNILNLSKPLIPFNRKIMWKFSIKWKFKNLQISKTYVKICKFKNR